MDEIKDCKRKIPTSKYEVSSPDLNTWWKQMFEILEDDFNIRQDRRFSILQEIIPQGLLTKLLAAISIDKEKFKDSEPSVVETKTKSSKSSIESILDSEDKEPSDSITTFERNLGMISQRKNLYMEFFKRKPDRVAIWRELPSLKWKEMRVGEMAEAVTEAIAKDFVKWLDQMGGEVGAETLTVQSIKEMFEIGTQSSCAGTVTVELQEIATVTQRTADSVGLSEKSKANFLQNQINKDRLAARTPPKISAFGRRLPSYMQVKPPPKDLYKKWLHCEHIPKRLETMAAVWKGITHLRSTRVFCEFLYKEQTQVKPPKYLVEAGLMDPKVFGKILTQAEENALQQLEEEKGKKGKEKYKKVPQKRKKKKLY